MKEIGFVLGGTVVVSVIAVCVCIAQVWSPTELERCATSCGQGRFKTFTGEVRVPGGPNVPEKCECGP